MAVTVNAAASADTHAETATSLNITNLTIAAGSNTALVLLVSWDADGRTAPASITCVWDAAGANQSLSEITHLAPGGSKGYTALYGLVAPVTGNKTLSISWTNSNEIDAFAIAFDGVDQTGGATSFPNATSNNGTGTSASLSVTSAVGNMAVAHFQTPSAFSSPSQTELWAQNGLSVHAYEGQRAAGAASVSFSAAISGSQPWGGVGCDILAAAGGGFFARYYYDMSRHF